MRMFITVLLLVFGVLGLGSTVAAQSGGVLGGLNIANLVSGPQDYSERYGGAGGFNFTPRINSLLGLQFEGYFTQKGATGDTAEIAVDTVAGRTVFNYFEAPAQLRLTTPGETARLFFSGGGAIAVRLHCSVALYNETNQLIPLQSCDGRTGADLIKGIDWSWTLGMGFDFKQGAEGFDAGGFFQTVEVRLVNGFQPIGQSGAPETLQAVRNRSIGFFVRGNVGN